MSLSFRSIVGIARMTRFEQVGGNEYVAYSIKRRISPPRDYQWDILSPATSYGRGADTYRVSACYC